MLKKLGKALTFKKSNLTADEPHIVASGQHPISPKDISIAATEVVQKLEDNGFTAYLVGGCVRDLLLGLRPKDFDVATNATPEQVKELFRRARIIGRRFRIVHVRFGREIIEVTTFRAHHNGDVGSGRDTSRRSKHGMLLRDNVFGSISEDASRRDFTINALYYHPADNTIYDYANGLVDIASKTLRIIGKPRNRYEEDPVRMLRVTRFAARLGFNIDPDTAAPIPGSAKLLGGVSSARLYDETIKLLMNGCALDTWRLLKKLQLDVELFPESMKLLDGNTFYSQFVPQALSNTDDRIRSGKHVTPAFLIAALLWPALCEQRKKLEEEGVPLVKATQQAGATVTNQQNSRLAIPKRFSIPMREIWEFQPRLHKRGGQQAFRLMDQPRFRAAYDFLLLREQSGEDVQNLGDWWTNFQDADENQRKAMVLSLGGRNKAGRRRPHKRKISS